MKRQAKLLLGTGSEAADIQHVTGFAAPDAVVFLEHGRQRYLLVPFLEYGRAQREAKHVHVLSVADLKLPRKKQAHRVQWIRALLKKTGVRSVTVSPLFPLAVADELRKAGISVRASSKPLFPERQVKTSAEVAKIREVQQAAVIAMRAAWRRLERATVDGRGYLRDKGRHLEAEKIRYIIERTLLERNCAAKGTIVACGAQAADPHEQGKGPLRAGEAIVIDIFPQHKGHGYWGDLTRTLVKGEPKAEVGRMYRAVKAAQRAALHILKARVQAKTVHRAVQDSFEKHGFKTSVRGGIPEGFIHGTGHGVGLEIHEAPSLGPSETRLRAGHVLTVEPGLYYPGVGGVRIEDTVVVTSTGWHYLFPCEKRLEV